MIQKILFSIISIIIIILFIYIDYKITDSISLAIVMGLIFGMGVSAIIIALYYHS